MIEAVLIPTLAVFLSYLQSERFHRNEATRAALEATLTALDETTAYVEIKATAPNRTTELHLSSLWTQAAYKMRELDPELSGILSNKSKYWNEINKLSRKEILENKMALWQVREQLSRFVDSDK